MLNEQIVSYTINSNLNGSAESMKMHMLKNVSNNSNISGTYFPIEEESAK